MKIEVSNNSVIIEGTNNKKNVFPLNPMVVKKFDDGNDDSIQFDSIHTNIATYTEKIVDIDPPMIKHTDTIDPTSLNDSSEGYIIGDFWYNSTTDFYYKMSKDSIWEQFSNKDEVIIDYCRKLVEYMSGKATPFSVDIDYSIYDPTQFKDFAFDVQRGLIPNAKMFTILGHSPLIGSVPETIWMKGGLYQGFNYNTATPLNIISTSDQDTLLGTGAQKILLIGLDENFLEITEEVDMNGDITAAVTTQSFTRINQAIVTQAGTAKHNIGDIDITRSDNDVSLSYISATYSFAHSAIVTVPADEDWYFYGENIDVGIFDTINNNRAVGVFIHHYIDSSVTTKILPFGLSIESPPTKIAIPDRYYMGSKVDWLINIEQIKFATSAQAFVNAIAIRIKK